MVLADAGAEVALLSVSIGTAFFFLAGALGMGLTERFVFALGVTVANVPEGLLPTAAAIELIHTYSLIHDDLPAMDDDDLRRGRPTCHVKYGEDVAILAGDGLFAEAINLFLAEQSGEPANVVAALRELAAATGVAGMVGGQYMDVAGADEAKEDVFNEQLTRQARAACAERRPDRHLAPPRRRPCELDACDVGGSRCEQQADRNQEGDQRRLHVRGHLVEHRHRTHGHRPFAAKDRDRRQDRAEGRESHHLVRARVVVGSEDHDRQQGDEDRHGGLTDRQHQPVPRSQALVQPPGDAIEHASV